MIPTVLEIIIAIGVISYMYGMLYGVVVAVLLILYGASSIVRL